MNRKYLGHYEYHDDIFLIIELSSLKIIEANQIGRAFYGSPDKNTTIYDIFTEKSEDERETMSKVLYEYKHFSFYKKNTKKSTGQEIVCNGWIRLCDESETTACVKLDPAYDDEMLNLTESVNQSPHIDFILDNCTDFNVINGNSAFYKFISSNTEKFHREYSNSFLNLVSQQFRSDFSKLVRDSMEKYDYLDVRVKLDTGIKQIPVVFMDIHKIDTNTNDHIFYCTLEKGKLSKKMEQARGNLVSQNYCQSLIIVELGNMLTVSESQVKNTIYRRIKPKLHPTDMFSFYENFEFRILMQHLRGNRDDKRVKENVNTILSELSKDFIIDNESVKPKVSVGISFSPKDGSCMPMLEKCSLLALNCSKEMEGNVTTYFSKVMECTQDG